MGLADTQDAKDILITYLNAGKGPDSENQQGQRKGAR